MTSREDASHLGRRRHGQQRDQQLDFLQPVAAQLGLTQAFGRRCPKAWTVAVVRGDAADMCGRAFLAR